ncbi:MAG: phosphatase PAP2 family protein [Alphaproteobacteria bacterium]|nr:phosphatase PAP2 family protein [Alphaproteobacteria bacterium]
MFLTKNNEMLWRRLAWGTLVTAVLVLMGVCCLDAPIYAITRGIGNWGIWVFLGRVFDAKIWILVSMIIFAVYGVKRLVKTIESIRDKRIQFKFLDILKETFVKTKTSHAFLILNSVFWASVIVWVLKVIIARLRPVFVMSGIIPEFDRFTWAWHSMPSGHTTVTFAGLVMIGMLAPKYKPLTWTLAVIVGASRIFIGAHWFSDVILGAFIGMVIADVVKWLLMKKINIGE